MYPGNQPMMEDIHKLTLSGKFYFKVKRFSKTWENYFLHEEKEVLDEINLVNFSFNSYNIARHSAMKREKDKFRTF